jgi:hypothetical protein
MEKIFKLGRRETSHIVFSDTKISRDHCTITVDSNMVAIIEDSNSTHGTFVNGRMVARAKLEENCVLQLGHFEVNVKLLLNYLRNTMPEKPITYGDLVNKVKNEIETFDRFLELKQVYENYLKQKKRIIQGNQVKTTGLRAGLSLIPIVGVALGTLAQGAAGNVQLKIMELDERFKCDYVCPACNRFLGNEPWANLHKRGSCHYCRAKFKEM